MNRSLLVWLLPVHDLGGKSKALGWIVLASVILASLWASAPSDFGRAVGLYEARYRAEMSYEAAFWALRAVRGASEVGEVSSTSRGYIEKGQSGYLLVMLYSGEGRTKQVVTLANVNNDTADLAKFAAKYKGQILRFDLFVLPTEKHPRALIWDVDRPLNLDVIEDGAGPDINPPTNIVDWIFARYYWHRARAGL